MQGWKLEIWGSARIEFQVGLTSQALKQMVSGWSGRSRQKPHLLIVARQISTAESAWLGTPQKRGERLISESPILARIQFQIEPQCTQWRRTRPVLWTWPGLFRCSDQVNFLWSDEDLHRIRLQVDHRRVFRGLWWILFQRTRIDDTLTLSRSMWLTDINILFSYLLKVILCSTT